MFQFLQTDTHPVEPMCTRVTANAYVIKVNRLIKTLFVADKAHVIYNRRYHWFHSYCCIAFSGWWHQAIT